jgi:hypothetical protein
MIFSHPTLVIYSFAPKRLPSEPAGSTVAHEYMRQLWQCCRRMGMTARLPNLNLSSDFPPTDGLHQPGFRAIAGAFDPERHARKEDYQAFLFEYQDVLGLIVALEAAAGHELSCWRALYEEWQACIKTIQPPDEMLGEVYLFSALYGENGQTDALAPVDANSLGRAALEALPAGQPAAWRTATLHLTNTGHHLWEGEEVGGRRALALLSAKENYDELCRWAIWMDEGQLAPFAAYLLHAAKVSFARRVYEREIEPIRQQQFAIEQALATVLSLHGRAGQSGIVAADELARAQGALSRSQVEGYGLFYSRTRLKELRVTAQIAKHNLRQLMPAAHAAFQHTELSLFRQDLVRADWLCEQIDVDLSYLEAARERAEEGYKLTTVQLEHEAQKYARRLNDLVLRQGTLIGSLVVGLSAMQALGGMKRIENLPDVFRWTLIGLLMSLALALPLFAAHWHERYGRAELFAGGVLGMMGALFVIFTWGTLNLPAWHVSFLRWLLFVIICAAGGFLLGWLGARWLNRRQQGTQLIEIEASSRN